MNFEIGSIFQSSPTSADAYRRALHLDTETAGRAGKVLVLIHENVKNINDGYFAWGNGHDLPSDVHYDGTTVVYADGHAKWGSHKQLMAEMNSGQWLGNTAYRKRFAH